MDRIHMPGAVYHVILRGNDRRDVFVDDKDRFRFYSILEYAFRHLPFRIHAFCLMTNHIHLEAQVADLPLPRIMQRIAQRYTQWFNWRHGRSGHLFQGRYKAILIEADEYLKELAAYIHLNPVRARIVKRPEEYRWSSHLAYLGNTTLPWIETDFILSTFSSSDRKKAQTLFQDFVDSTIGQGRNKSFHGERNMDKRLLGDDYFVLDILERIEEAPPKKPGLEEIIEAIKSILGEDTHRLLTTSGRDARSFEARALAAWAVIELSSATVTELGKYCRRDQSTMSCAARRIEELQAIRPDLAAQMEQLRSALTHAPKASASRPLPAEDASDL